MEDLRIALRSLRRAPAASALILGTLGLGVGAAATVFALVDALLLRDLPYHDADRLVAVFRVERAGTETRNPTTPPDFIDWSEAGVFETAVAARIWTPTLTGDGEPERIHALRATPELFTLLGVPEALGRTFHGTMAAEGGENRVVLGHALWQRRFGGAPDIVGRTITLDGRPHEIIAVMPRGFSFPPFWATEAELWAPLVFSPEEAAARGAAYLRVFARLAPGVTVEQAQAEMDGLAARLAAIHPQTNADAGINVEPLHVPSVARSRPALLVIAGAVALTLIVACMNAGSVMLVRALARRRDMAVRIALGAGRARLLRTWLAESMVLAAGSAVIGLVLALWAVRLINVLQPAALPKFRAVSIDLRVALFVTGISLLAGMVLGVWPALRAAGHDIARALHGRASGATMQRTRDALVAGQVAMASAILVIATLLADGFVQLTRIDPGFDTREVVSAEVGFAGERYSGLAAQQQLLDAILEQVGGAPGVSAAGAVNHLPVGGDFWRSAFVAEGIPESSGSVPTASYRVATGGYFDALGSAILRGRTFDARDRDGQLPVAIINQTLARQTFGEADPVGRRIALGREADHGEWLEVIGVVEDALQQDPATPIVPEIHLPYAQNPVSWHRAATIVVRGEDAVALERLIRDAVAAVDPGLPVEPARTMDAVLSARLADRRFGMLVIGAFAAGAVLLALVGLYSVVAQLARMRSRELAIRMAIGASRTDVVRLVLGHGASVVGVGLMAGAVLTLPALAAARGLMPLQPRPLAAFAASTLILGACAFLATAAPALRAGRIPLIRSLAGD